jgi:Flp pilus assembly protein TadB
VCVARADAFADTSRTSGGWCLTLPSEHRPHFADKFVKSGENSRSVARKLGVRRGDAGLGSLRERAGDSLGYAGEAGLFVLSVLLLAVALPVAVAATVLVAVPVALIIALAVIGLVRRRFRRSGG